MISVRRTLIMGWLLLFLFVLLRRFDGAPQQQAPIQTLNQVQVTDVYSPGGR